MHIVVVDSADVMNGWIRAQVRCSVAAAEQNSANSEVSSTPGYKRREEMVEGLASTQRR